MIIIKDIIRLHMNGRKSVEYVLNNVFAMKINLSQYSNINESRTCYHNLNFCED